MTCDDAKGMIWAGESSKELEEHLQTCPACQEEVEEMKRLIGTLGIIQTPVPSRTLTPSRDIIRATVRKNRRSSLPPKK